MYVLIYLLHYVCNGTVKPSILIKAFRVFWVWGFTNSCCAAGRVIVFSQPHLGETKVKAEITSGCQVKTQRWRNLMVWLHPFRVCHAFTIRSFDAHDQVFNTCTLSFIDLNSWKLSLILTSLCTNLCWRLSWLCSWLGQKQSMINLLFLAWLDFMIFCSSCFPSGGTNPEDDIVIDGNNHWEGKSSK